MNEHRTDVWVCANCLFAHHYGASQVDGQWFAGESDTPADRMPLGLIGSTFAITDNVCSDHNPFAETCDECGTDDDGIADFSSSRCEGCDSKLAGARYRLVVWS